MPRSDGAHLSYLRKVFLIAHVTGLAAGLLFPLLIYPLVGAAALTLPFFSAAMLMGVAVGTALYQMVRLTLMRQLRAHLALLRPLTGKIAAETGTVEDLEEALDQAVTGVETFVEDLLTTIDAFIPHYRSLNDSGQYLHKRAQEGLSAGEQVHSDVETLGNKQKEISHRVDILDERTHDEAGLSRELAASLEEMASAIDHSTSQFLETTTCVDELAASVREVSGQAVDIAHSVENSAQNLDAIRDTLEKIRHGASAGNQAAEAVRNDAGAGLQVVKASLAGMDRIEGESRQAKEAMQRLSAQAGEVAKIIVVIKNLVSDTELLAFNAAIIAAKAGEEGRGFSVVAEEIRDLADRTTASAQDIEKIVKAIGCDTREAMNAVETTSERIAEGKQLSRSTDIALTKIVESAALSARASEEIAEMTGREGERSQTLLSDAGSSLRSVKAITRSLQEQQGAIARVQEGVNAMKTAADQVARGMEEQVRANNAFTRSLGERDTLIQAITEATRMQTGIVEKVSAHFAASRQRLQNNAEKSAAIAGEISQMEGLAGRLRERARALRERGDSDRSRNI